MMTRHHTARPEPEAGVTLIELLVSLVVIAIGLLGILQLYARGQQSELEAQQHSQALVLVDDIAARIEANRSAAQCYDFTADATGDDPTWVGTGNTDPSKVTGCGVSATRAVADQDLSEWAAELASDSLVGGRGCITSDMTGDTDEYTITIAWQGRSRRQDPDAACAKGEYGGVNDADESKRRTVSRTIDIAELE